MAKFIPERLDHAAVFLVLATIGVFALGRLMGVGLRAVGLNGPASIFLGS